MLYVIRKAKGSGWRVVCVHTDSKGAHEEIERRRSEDPEAEYAMATGARGTATPR